MHQGPQQENKNISGRSRNMELQDCHQRCLKDVEKKQRSKSESKSPALKQSMFFSISFNLFFCLRATLCASFANLDQPGQLSFLSDSAPPKYLALAMGCSRLACEEWLPRVPWNEIAWLSLIYLHHFSAHFYYLLPNLPRNTGCCRPGTWISLASWNTKHTHPSHWGRS